MTTEMQRPGVDVDAMMLAGVNPETMVIAAIIREASVLRDVGLEMLPDDFLDMRLGEIMRGVARMVSEREPVETFTVGRKLASWGVRGLDVNDLLRWDLELTTAANAGYYARLVRVESIRRQAREVATRLHQSSGGDPVVAVAEGLTALTQLRDGTREERFASKTLGTVLEAPDDYDWVVDGLLERRERLMLTGQEGQGKSTVIRQIAICAAAGVHPFTFKPTEPARVLVVDIENSERQWRRTSRPLVVRAAAHGSRNPAEVMALACVEQKFDITNDHDIGSVHRLIDVHKPDLIAIGPLYRLVPWAINGDDEAAPVLTALDTIRDRGAALLIEAHAGHSVGRDRERDLRPRGSSALLGWPEFGMGLRHKPGGVPGDFQLVRWRGDRDRRNWPTAIRRALHENEWPWTPTRFTFAPLEEPT